MVCYSGMWFVIWFVVSQNNLHHFVKINDLWFGVWFDLWFAHHCRVCTEVGATSNYQSVPRPYSCPVIQPTTNRSLQIKYSINRLRSPPWVSPCGHWTRACRHRYTACPRHGPNPRQLTSSTDTACYPTVSTQHCLEFSTDRCSREVKAIANVRLSVRLSVRLFPLYLLNWLIFELLSFCMYVVHDHSSAGIKSQGHRSRSKVNVKFQRVWACKRGNAVGLTSILDPGQFFLFSRGSKKIRSNIY